MLLTPSPISSKYFSYSKGTHRLVSEYSTLRKTFRLDRVYSDSADVGFTIVSDTTGKEVVFVLVEKRMVNGDLKALRFKSVTPGHTGLSALIFNY